MNIREDMFLFSGYCLGHALYSVSDISEEEILTPFALSEKEQKQSLQRFYSEDIEVALDAADDFIVQNVPETDLLSFAKEVLLRGQEGVGIDALLIKTWSRSLDNSVAVIQPYVPFYKNNRLIIEMEMILQVNNQSIDNPESIIPIVKEGILEHQAASKLYLNWCVIR